MSYTGITTDMVRFAGHGGDQIEAYVARPQGQGPFPSVVMIHHAPGLDEWSLEFTWKLAHRGFSVVAPHIYSRVGMGMPDEAPVRARAIPGRGLADAPVVGDVAASIAYMRSQPNSNGKVGVIGFCATGRTAYLAACQLTDINAVVDCWGGGVAPEDPTVSNEFQPVAPITLTANLNCPLLGIFGNEDEGPSPAEVDRTEKVLKELGKTYEFYRYDGANHAFMATDRYRYRVEQAVDAWGRITSFLHRHLGSTAAAGGPPRFIGASPSVHVSGDFPLRS